MKMQEKIGEQRKFLSVTEVSNYLSIKEKTIYARVEAGDIPCYRIGKLIRFNKDEIDAWVGTKKVIKVDPDEAAKNILRSIRKPSIDVQKVVRKTIDEAKGDGYTLTNGKPDDLKGSKQEVNNGNL